MKGVLYVVATPIGNAGDISSRAARVLAEVDIVAAEDTRTAQKLLTILEIRNKTVSNHKFNEKHQAEYLLSELEKGRNIALVSDAGTPCVSDPGGILVKEALGRGIVVAGIPGASAVVTALSICGFCFDSFAFFGFLPRSPGEIRKALENARKSRAKVSVFFESPKRIKKSLEIFAEETPDAELCLCNDLTKAHERIYRGAPRKILLELLANPASEKGEYTLAASLGPEPEPVLDNALSPEALLVDHLVKNGGSLKDAVKTLAEKPGQGFAKKELYAASLKLRSLLPDRNS